LIFAFVDVWIASKNGALRRIFGAKWEETAGGWRKLLVRGFIICIAVKMLGSIAGGRVECA
jgi:hypothetical protein